MEHLLTVVRTANLVVGRQVLHKVEELAAVAIAERLAAASVALGRGLGDSNVVDAVGGAVAASVLPGPSSPHAGGSGVEGEARSGGHSRNGGGKGGQHVGTHLVLDAAHALLLADADGVPE